MGQLGFWKRDTEPADPLAYGRRLLDVAIRRYRPVAVFGMFSGGHDSLVATHLAAQRPEFTAAVHINTGIGIEETMEFVRRTAEEQGWPLLEYSAVELGQDYDELVVEHGFPGPFHHRKMYNRLKERGLRQLVREHKVRRRDKVLLVTGVRRAESTRRMGTVDAINREGARVWCAPLTWFKGYDKNAYIEAHDLPRNEVVDHLHMSGECLCGAFAKPGELEWIEFMGYHDVVERIRDLERRAVEAGAPYCRWGKTGQATKGDTPSAPGFLCVGCEGGGE